MWRSPNIPSLWTLAPRTPEDRHVLYCLVRDAMLTEFPTQPAVARQLSLVAVRHLAGEGVRALIRGPDEAQTETLVRKLAELLDIPFIEIDVAALAETNWHGADLPFFLSRLRANVSERYGLAHARSLAEQACILVSHLESGRLASAYSSASTRDHRAGKQAVLAQLFAGRSIPVAPDHGSEFVWNGHRALVVGTGEFSDIRTTHMASSELQSWGMIPDLADAIAAAVAINVAPPTVAEIEGRLQAQVRRLVARFLEYGYHLRVEEQVIRYVAEELAGGPWGGGIATGVAWIAAAAESTLIRMLDEDAAQGTVWVLARDDISLPEPPRGVWRE